jgi:two-component system, sensor histidine kinase and response regulator
VTDESGALRALIVATIHVPYLEQVFSEVRVGEHGMISIRRSDDSRLVVRWPIVESEINLPAAKTPPYQRILAGERRGVIRYVGKTDGVDRIFAYYRISDFPFYVLVGRAVEEQFRFWLNSAIISTALTLSGLVLIAGLLRPAPSRRADTGAERAAFPRPVR